MPTNIANNTIIITVPCSREYVYEIIDATAAAATRRHFFPIFYLDCVQNNALHAIITAHHRRNAATDDEIGCLCVGCCVCMQCTWCGCQFGRRSKSSDDEFMNVSLCYGHVSVAIIVHSGELWRREMATNDASDGKGGESYGFWCAAPSNAEYTRMTNRFGSKHENHYAKNTQTWMTEQLRNALGI